MKTSKKLGFFMFFFCMAFMLLPSVSSAPDVTLNPGDETVEIGTTEEWDFGTYFSGSAGAFNMFGQDKIDSVSFQIGDSYTSNTYTPSSGEYTLEAQNQASDQWSITVSSLTPSGYNGPYNINDVVLEACSGNCNQTDPFDITIDAPDPDQISSPASMNLNYNETSSKSYSSIFDSNTYTVENAFFSDPVDSASASIGDDYASNTYSPSGNEYTVEVTSGGDLKVTSEQTDVNINDMKMQVCNDYDNCKTTNGFTVDISGTSGGGGGGGNSSLSNNSLISAYKLNETSGSTALDSAGSNDGTYNGNLPTSVTGKDGNAQDFDGSNDYINTSIETAGDLDLSSGSNYSFSFWVNEDSSSRWEFISNTNDRTSNGLAIWSTGTEYRVYVNGNNIGLTSSPPSNNDWHNVVVTKDSNDNFELYVNGTSKSTASSSANGNQDNIHLGASPDGNEKFDGQIDEVYIWDRSLNSTEVSNLSSGEFYPFTTTTTSNQTKPSVLANPVNNAMTFNDQVNYNYDNFFNNYSTVNAYFQDIDDSVSVTIGDNWTSKNYTSSNGDYDVNVNNDIFTVNSGTTNTKLQDIKLESCNSQGCSTTNEFNISISGSNISKPTVTSNVNDISMKYNSSETITDLPSFFLNETSVDIAFTDPIDSQSTIVGNGSFSQSSYSPSGNNYTISYSNGDITINSKETDVNISDAELVGCNLAGCNRTNEFSIVISEDGTAGTGTEDENFVEWLTEAFGGIFPDSDNVSNMNGFLYFLVLSILTIAVIMGISIRTGFQGGTLLSIVLVIFFLIFFTIIGYIGVGILIAITLIALAIIYLMRGNR